MASRGEAHDADLRRVDVPIGGVVADETDRALGILQRHGMTVAVDGQTVLKHERRHAPFLEPSGFVEPFVVKGEEFVAASRTNDDGGRGCTGLFWQKNREGRDVFLRPSPSFAGQSHSITVR